MAKLTVEERVANGVTWLDENQSGWVDRINLDRLVMRSPCRCVLGQLFGDFWDAPAGVHGNKGEAMGFESILSLGGFVADFAALDAEWKRVITARREADR